MFNLIAIAPNYSFCVVKDLHGGYYEVSSISFESINEDRLQTKLYDRIEHDHLKQPKEPMMLESIAAVQYFLASFQLKVRTIPRVGT